MMLALLLQLVPLVATADCVAPSDLAALEQRLTTRVAALQQEVHELRALLQTQQTLASPSAPATRAGRALQADVEGRQAMMAPHPHGERSHARTYSRRESLRNSRSHSLTC